MSIPEVKLQKNLFGIEENSHQLYPADDKYRLFAQKIHPLLLEVRPQLIDCYCQENGRPAIEPILLLGVSLLQFLEKAPDRKAVEMIKYHLGWNIALCREIEEPIFHSTALVRFRQRLVENEKSQLAFNLVLEGLKKEGLLKESKRQRIDSTYVVGLVAKMSQLECFRETLRLALEEINQQAGEEQLPAYWQRMWDQYVETKLDYQLTREALAERQRQAGVDMQQLLSWVAEQREWEKGEKVKLLERVFGEYFRVEEAGQIELQTPEQRESDRVINPHDPEATWSTKGRGDDKKSWVGYKVQIAETVVEEQAQQAGEPTPNFLTAIETQSAIESDQAGKQQVEEAQKQSGLQEPEEWYADAAYVSAEKLAEAEAKGQQLWGPAQLPPGESHCKVDAFQIRVEERKAICPRGEQSTQCSRLEEKKSGKISYRFEWGRKCIDCPLAGQCVGKGQKHRSIEVGEHHSQLQSRRQQMKTEEFKDRMKRRNGIEGSQSELIRGHGLRKARYRGLKKVRLQNYLIGAACNIKRWVTYVSFRREKLMAVA